MGRCRLQQKLEEEVDQARQDRDQKLADMKRQMEEAVAILDFETAAILRDEIRYLEELK